jgi:hypothetical protein
MDFIDRPSESDKGRNDRSGACAKHKVEPLIQRLANEGFNSLENAQRIETLGSSAIEREKSTGWGLGIYR